MSGGVTGERGAVPSDQRVQHVEVGVGQVEVTRPDRGEGEQPGRPRQAGGRRRPSTAAATSRCAGSKSACVSAIKACITSAYRSADLIIQRALHRAPPSRRRSGAIHMALWHRPRRARCHRTGSSEPSRPTTQSIWWSQLGEVAELQAHERQIRARSGRRSSDRGHTTTRGPPTRRASPASHPAGSIPKRARPTSSHQSANQRA